MLLLMSDLMLQCTCLEIAIPVSLVDIRDKRVSAQAQSLEGHISNPDIRAYVLCGYFRFASMIAVSRLNLVVCDGPHQ